MVDPQAKYLQVIWAKKHLQTQSIYPVASDPDALAYVSEHNKYIYTYLHKTHCYQLNTEIQDLNGAIKK